VDLEGLVADLLLEERRQHHRGRAGLLQPPDAVEVRRERRGADDRRRAPAAIPRRGPPDVDRAGRQALLATPPGARLEAPALERLLLAYGLPLARSRLVRSAGEAAAAQAEMGRPVAVKLQSRAGIHKTDVGGVVLGCGSPEAAAAAYRDIEASVGVALGPDAMDGALIQEMADAGPDLIVGATFDPLFGPLVLAIGGVQAELWRDSALALAPVGARTAAGLWDRLRGGPLLDGWRGSRAADREPLVDVVVRIARLAADQPLLAELDCNPVRALGPGRGAVILDARARRAADGPEAAIPRRGPVSFHTTDPPRP
jgi:acyl-CoA synthetase (NDP forming)